MKKSRSASDGTAGALDSVLKPHDPSQPSASADARQAAWSVLMSFEAGSIDRLGEALDALKLPERDEGLARELVFGVARYQRLYDALCTPWLRPGVQPLPLRMALRLACHQLFALDRIPLHAAVDTSVELLRHFRQVRLTGVANAVIRKLSGLRTAQRLESGPLGRLVEEAWPKDPGLRYSLPDALVADLRATVADDPSRLAGLNQIAHLCTRSRPGTAHLNGTGILKQEGEWTWWENPQEALAGPVAQGLAVVQDRSQGRLVELSRPRPGDLVLDCCAAPGGKAMAFLDRGCRVVASDLSAVRMKRLRANTAGKAPLLRQDVRCLALAEAFDLVVVDAPCSNTGVLGRRPEARWRYLPDVVRSLEDLQREALAGAARLVRQGGRLVYATCSVCPRENQGIAHRLDGWRILSEESSWPDEWQAGGYVAVLVRS